jgi:hypothetical protein
VLDRNRVDNQDEEINDDNVHHCFIDFQSIKASAELLTTAENVPLEDLLPLWEEEGDSLASTDGNDEAKRVEDDEDVVDGGVLRNP